MSLSKLREEIDVTMLIITGIMWFGILLLGLGAVGEMSNNEPPGFAVMLFANFFIFIFFTAPFLATNNNPNNFGEIISDKIDWKFVVFAVIQMIYASISIVLDKGGEPTYIFTIGGILSSLWFFYLPSVFGFMAGNKKYWVYLVDIFYKIFEKKES